MFDKHKTISYNTTPLSEALGTFAGGVNTSPQTQPQSSEPTYPVDDTPINSHSSIMIIPDFISEEDCQFLVNYADDKTAVDLSVFDAEKANQTGKLEWETDKKVRDTQSVEYDADLAVTFNKLIGHAVSTYINQFYNINLQSAEAVQFLKYGVGGHYTPHIDGEALWHNKDSNTLEWRKNIERDISILIYLNNEYEGGDLVFPNQSITLNPKAGMLVAFPSNHNFLHGVMPVTKGTRYALVSWASLATPE